MKYIVGFFAFWWDFIVGDSIVLAVGTVAALVAAWLVAHSGVSSAAQVVLPLGVVATLVLALRKT